MMVYLGNPIRMTCQTRRFGVNHIVIGFEMFKRNLIELEFETYLEL